MNTPATPEFPTICAISTPTGTGGIAVIRISGPHAITITDKVWRGKSLTSATTHTAHLGYIIDPQRPDEPVDQAVATVYRAPRSFTGENTVELAVHGSRWIQREVLRLLIHAGCTLAEPGEFTHRALRNGRIDLAQAEGIADVIAANSRAANRLASTQMRGIYSQRLETMRSKLVNLASLMELELDFSDQEVEFADRTHLADIASSLLTDIDRLTASFTTGAAIKDGIPIAIAGATNAGKSSLLNALLGDNRAIVSNIHGTTRDTIEDTVEIGDYLFRFIDTAGLRTTTDTIERLGIERSIASIARARITLLVIDPTAPIPTETVSHILTSLAPHATLITLINKTDLATPAQIAAITAALIPLLTTPTNTPATAGDANAQRSETPDKQPIILQISAETAANIEALRQQLCDTISAEAALTSETDIIVTNLRHAEALRQAAQSTRRILDGLTASLPGDLIAQDIRETIHHLSTITTPITTPELLHTIFSTFCIGK